jgi:serine/threonine protein kinase
MPQHPRWTPVGPSAHDREEKALAWLADQLLDDPGAHLWSNFIFEASTGKMYEVDGLLLCSHGLFVVEIKSHTDATFAFEGNRWWVQRARRDDHMDNPRVLADIKARCLKGELERHGVRHRVVYVGSAVWLSEPTVRCTDGSWTSANGIYFHNALGHLRPIGRLLDGSALPHEHRAPAYLPSVGELRRALDAAGIVARDLHRRLDNGNYLIEQPLDHQPEAAWQDFLVVEKSSGMRCRARVFPLDTSARTPADREARRSAARREYETLSRLTSPGHSAILQALRFVDDERGPTIIFPWLDDYEPLDTWLRRHPNLDFEHRRRLLLAIADPLRYAHNQHVYHRGLNPRAILVPSQWPHATDGPPAIRITDWLGAAHTARSQHTNALPVLDPLAHVYAAPELLLRPEHASSHADIYSLGALAFLVWTGRAPAWGGGGLTGERAPLQPTAFVDTLPPWTDEAVGQATAHDPARRFASVDAWIDRLTPPADPKRTEASRRSNPGTGLVDPLHAQSEDFCEGFMVERRVGEGGSAVVLAVLPEDGEPVTVALKVAKDGHDDALRAEGEAYQRLHEARCQRVVPYQMTYTFTTPVPRTAIVLQWLGEACTLHAHLQGRPLPLADAREFGSQLLQALEELERVGVLHRDIKPANLAIWAGNKQRRELYLFDFSLAGVPSTHTDVGTRPYQDPWVGAAHGRPVHDAVVDRWSAAVVLHEMLTGTRPGWGTDGTAGPSRDPSVPLWLNTTMMPQAHRQALAAFFEQALQPDVVARFANAADMRAAWDQIFATQHASRPRDKGEWLHSLRGLLPNRPLRECDLPADLLDYLLHHLEERAAEAGEPADLTAGALAAQGSQVYIAAPSSLRPSVRALYEALRELFHTASTSVGHGALRARDILELATDASRGKMPAAEAHQHRRLLGLHEHPGAVHRPWPWPDHRALAERLDLGTDGFAAYLDGFRARLWRKSWRAPLVQQALAILANHTGVVTDSELAWGLLAHFGSDALDPRQHAINGRALAHMATLLLESNEFRAESPDVQVMLVRGERGLLVTTDPELAGLLPALADELDALSNGGAPVSSSVAAVAIARASRNTPLSRLNTARLATCASHISRWTAVAATEELYSIRMSHAALLQATARSLVHRAHISFADLKSLLASRFDQAPVLPDYDTTCTVLRSAGFDWRSYGPADAPQGTVRPPTAAGGQLGLALNDDQDRGWYIHHNATGALSTHVASSSTRFSLGASVAAGNPAHARALELQRSLQTRYERGGFCVLLAERADHGRMLNRLLGRWPDLHRVSVERMWHAQMSEALERAGLSWHDAIGEASLPAASLDRQEFEQWLDASVWQPLQEALQNQTGDVLYTECGTLPPAVRTDLFGALRDHTGRPGWPRLAWVWAPMVDNQQQAVAIDGHSIVTTTPSQRITLTRAWGRLPPESPSRA